MKPISIILPVYNGMSYLQPSIESILQQSFHDFEFLIIDDCSTDKSWEYLCTLNDSRIKLFRNEVNKGLFFNLNFLIKQSTAPLIKLWAQDDIMYADCITSIINFYQKNPAVGFIYSGYDYIDGKGILIPNNTIDETPDIVSTQLHTRIAFYTGSIAGNIANVTLTKSALEKTGLFNEDMKICGDFDMWVRCARYFPTGFIRKHILQLRNHEGQFSRQQKYYIHHLKEDILVYNYLFSYSSQQEAEDGRKMLRNRKLLLYYTIMLKALFTGHFKTAFNFIKGLNSFDNIIKLTWFFFRNKILKRELPQLYSEFEKIQYLQQLYPKTEIGNSINQGELVSVIIISHNREKYIAEAIDSILNSSYTNFELIIVDDCSTDSTVLIARSYEQKDNRVKVFVNAHNIGQFKNRNLAVSYSKGKYIKFVDSDDYIFSTTLQAMVQAMEQYPVAAMGICQATKDEKEVLPELIDSETAYKQHFYGRGVLRYGPTGTIIKREIFNKLGGFNDNRFVGDTEFWLKLSALYQIVKLQPGLVFWRMHPTQEFYLATVNHSFIEDSYKIYIRALKSENCPLKQYDIKKITNRLQWKQARDILNLGFKKSNLSLAMKIFKNSDLNIGQLLIGLIPYKIIKYRF